MKRESRLTEDGSHTLWDKELEEPYHSIHGAIQESMHVFITQGLQTQNLNSIRILELGMGTGLNLLLTLSETIKNDVEVYYHTVEMYPLTHEEFSLLNYESLVDSIPAGSIYKIHEAPWGQPVQIMKRFTLHKELSDFKSMTPGENYDLIYHDAFDPKKQPHLWSKEIFSKIYGIMNPGGIWVSYTAKGSVRRNLLTCGFEVDRIPGPPGKSEMLRAVKS